MTVNVDAIAGAAAHSSHPATTTAATRPHPRFVPTPR